MIFKKRFWWSPELKIWENIETSFLLHSTYELLPNATNLKLWAYTDSDMYLSCKSDRGTLSHVLYACPQSLQMYTWRHNKVLEVVIELLIAQSEIANQQLVTAKEPIIQFLKEGKCPVRKQKKIPKWIYWMQLVSGKFKRISRHLYNFQFTLFKQKSGRTL